MYRHPLIVAIVTSLLAGLWLLGSVEPTVAQDAPKLVKAKDGSCIVGYKDTPLLPWCGYRVHDPDRPAPPKVTPGSPSHDEKAAAPSDATVLFNGTKLSKWKPSDWKTENGELIAVSGNLTTTESFGDCQLHLEWQAPDPPRGSIWDRGNNGVMLMGLFEIQIYDSYTTKIYPDGQAASIYGQTPPMVNASRKPGQWQSYDIIFLRRSSRTASSKSPLMSPSFTTACSSITTRRFTARPVIESCLNMSNRSCRNCR